MSFNLKNQRVLSSCFTLLSLFSAPSGRFRVRTVHGRKLVETFF
jgi:hypothetical protein